MRLAILALLPALLWGGLADAQGFHPPPFAGGIPGQVQMRSIALQRHQARTLLYREAIEELRRNPRVVDVHECGAGEGPGDVCLPKAAADGVPQSVADKPIGRRFALLFGNHTYQPPIPPLETPPKDVDQVAAKLRDQFGFDARVVKDATKADIVRAVAEVARQAKPEDSVFIYYAGHGYLMDDTEMGYWIPVDGTVKTAKQWISNADISKLLHAIPARQVMLVSDSCFSGTLTREQSVDTAGPPKSILARRSVLVLSSGGEEPVSDEGREGHSIFAWHFLRSLGELKDSTRGYNVFEVVRNGVKEDFPQTPEYGAVISAGHQPGGEYLFDRN